MRTGGEKTSFRSGKVLYVVLCLFVASVAHASPTIQNQNAILTADSCPDDTPILISAGIDNTAGTINPKLVNLDKGFLYQLPSVTAPMNAQLGNIKPLPAAPAAILMVAIGFLCVSFVRDRRLWLAALAGLLWVGQAGVQALPHFTFHHCYRIQNKQHNKLAVCLHSLENIFQSRSKFEDVSYTGLLHWAKITDNKGALTNTSTSHSVILSALQSFNPSRNPIISTAEQFFCFSPAFIFQSIPRGPPKFT